MRQVIAVCGQSAVGKATLIQRLIDSDVDLRNRFEIGDHAIVTAGAKFGTLPDVVDNASVVVWKWQWRNDDWFRRLLSKYPKARHRAIVLWLPPSIHAQRMKSKWPKRSFSQQSSQRSFNNRIAPHFKRKVRRLGIEVELVDASTTLFVTLEKWPE